VLDDGDHARGHEAGRAHGLTGAGHLGDLDRAARHRHLDAPAGGGRRDLELAHAVADVDEHLDPVAPHGGPSLRCQR